MRIVFVTPFYKPAYVYGGPIHSISTLCEAMASFGVATSVITTDANGKTSLPERYRGKQHIAGVDVHYCKRELPGNFFFSRHLGQACKTQINKDNVDLVYVASNWGHPFIPACRVAERSNVPYVVSPRASFKRSTWRGKAMKKWFYHTLFERRLIQRAAGIHYTTQMERNDSRWLRLHPPTIVVPNPVNFVEFDDLPERGTFRAQFGIAQNIPILLFLGRIDPDKGLPLAIRALPPLLSRFPGLLFVIAGPEENNHIAQLHELAKALGINSKLHFTGLLDPHQRSAALVDADVFLLPSHSENFGMAAVEAMVCGLPVVVSDQVGIADMINEEQAGIVTPLEPDAIASAVMKLLSDPQLARSMGAAGSKVVRQRYAPTEIAHRMLAEFDRILSERQRD